MMQILTISISFVIAYAVIMSFILIIQDRLIFITDKLKEDHSFDFNQAFEEYYIETGDKVKINALLFKSNNSSKGLIKISLSID